MCERLEEAPFLLPLMCALISPQFKLFPVAGLLASARRGWWAEDDTVFMVDESLSSRARTGVWGVVESAPIQDMGKVTVILHGSDVVLIRFSVSWPKIARPTNSHFMPDQCRLHLVHPKRPEHSLVQTPNTDVAYLSLGLPAWERRLGKNLPIELRIILEGNYCVSRTGPWWTPIFMRNHSSWNVEAEEALWPTIAKWLWKGILEYVPRQCRLPLCILP